MNYWNAIPAQFRDAIVKAALILLGAATELAFQWLDSLGNQAGV
jgi:hypothetical protein